MASIRRLNTAQGVRYEVRWRPAPGQTERSRRFDSLERAKAFKSQTEAAQSRGIAYDPTGGRIPFRRWNRPLRERIPSTASRAYRIMHAILATADRDRALAERLDELVDGLRTSANTDDSEPDPAERPAGVAGFSAGRRVVTSAST